MKLLFTSILFSISTVTLAQSYKDSILLLNGISYNANITEYKGGVLHFEYITKKGHYKTLEMTRSRIFSYHKNGTESIMYQKNPDIIDDFEVHEMKRYAIGGYDARQTYNPRYVFWTTLVATYGISLWDTYLTQKAFNPVQFPDLNAGFFGKGPTMVPFVAPLVFSLGFAMPKMRVKDKYIVHKNYHGDQMYYNGFNDYSRKKRLFGALKGSAIGLGLGLISYSILKIN